MDKGTTSLALVLTATVSLALGAGLMYLKNKDQLEFTENYSAMLEMQDFMKDTDAGLPDDPDKADIYNAYLALYGDDYTFVSDEDPRSAEGVTKQVNASSTAVGSGFEIDITQSGDQNVIAVTKVEEKMAADKAGLKVGDIIVEIGGVDVVKTEPVAARDIMGKEGETLDLKVLRGDKYENISFARVTDKDKASGISSEMLGDTLYIKVEGMTMFNAGNFADQFDDKKYKSLLIDLRENGGGDLGVALNMAALISKSPEATLHYNSGKTESLKSDEGIQQVVDSEIPVVVLVNEETASAAEAMTAILKDDRGATVVGMKTFGKSSFQENGFIGGYSIQYTSGFVTIGNRANYHGVGISPDVEVEMPAAFIGTDDDIQLQAALDLLG